MADWWSIAGTAVLALGAVYALRVGVFPVRRPGRRCRGCGYEMSGIAGLRCPECGREHRREADLSASRRPRRAVVGLVLSWMLGHLCFSAPRAWARGWVGLVPTAALMGAASELDPHVDRVRGAGSGVKLTDRFSAELQWRLLRGGAWRWEQLLFQRRCAWAAETDALASGLGLSEPQVWLFHSVEAIGHSAWATRSYLQRGLEVGLTAPSRWPADRPLSADFNPPWMPGDDLWFEFRLPEGGRGAIAGEGWTFHPPPLYDLPTGRRMIEYEARCLHRDSEGHSVEFWRGSVRRSVEIVPTIDDMLTAWTADQVEAFVRKAVHFKLTLGTDKPQESITGVRVVTVEMTVDGVAWKAAGAPPMSFRPAEAHGLRLEGTDLPYANGPNWLGLAAPVLPPGEFVTKASGPRVQSQIYPGSITLTVRGSGDAALACEGAKSYWEGELFFECIPAEREAGEMTLRRVKEPGGPGIPRSAAPSPRPRQ